MRPVTIRYRGDGLVEIAPRLSPLDATERMLVITSVLLVAGGLFVAGLMPAMVLAAIAACSLAGEVYLGLRALALVLLRPPAQVVEVRVRAARRT